MNFTKGTQVVFGETLFLTTRTAVTLLACPKTVQWRPLTPGEIEVGESRCGGSATKAELTPRYRSVVQRHKTDHADRQWRGMRHWVRPGPQCESGVDSVTSPVMRDRTSSSAAAEATAVRIGERSAHGNANQRWSHCGVAHRTARLAPTVDPPRRLRCN